MTRKREGAWEGEVLETDQHMSGKEAEDVTDQHMSGTEAGDTRTTEP